MSCSISDACYWLFSLRPLPSFPHIHRGWLDKVAQGKDIAVPLPGVCVYLAAAWWKLWRTSHGPMTDILSKEKRSEVMAAIRSSGNRSTELRLARILRASSITGWRRDQALAGRPDFVFRQERLAVFVDGCFWHGCPWHCRMPKSEQGYWEPKISRNKARDKAIRDALVAAGWRVHRIWEHSLKRPSKVSEKLIRLLRENTAKHNGRPF